MNILLTGATGHVGSQLLKKLSEHNHLIKILTRNKNKKELMGCKCFYGDVIENSFDDGAFKNIDAAYYLIHSMSEEGFEEKDILGAKNFAIKAEEHGVKKIIYLGGLPGESDHLKNRIAVGSELRKYSSQVIEIRASIIVGSGSDSFEIIRYICESYPVIVYSEKGNNLTQPIYLNDIINVLSKALELSGDEIIEAGGPDVLSYKQILEIYCEERGLGRKFIELHGLPDELIKAAISGVAPINGQISDLLIEGMGEDLLVKNNSAEEKFNLNFAPYRDAVKNILSEGKTFYENDELEESELSFKEGFIIETIETESRKSKEEVLSILNKNDKDVSDLFFEFIKIAVSGFFPVLNSENWKMDNTAASEIIYLNENDLFGERYIKITLTESNGLTKVLGRLFFRPKGLTGRSLYLTAGIRDRIFLANKLAKVNV